ncbi:sterol desaturase family protein [Acidobacteria bacterium AH-259-L09]|nr:sterol desaturase family protein [Acidobacteria bacterium AH-259-L09]
MKDWIMSNEPVIRLGFFAGIFGLMAIWEAVAARRELTAGKGRRWFGNLGLVLLDTLIVRLLFPAATIGMALMAEDFGWGLFNTVEVPYWLAVVLSVVLLDFAIYLQHVMFHAIPALWRLHMVHHADVDFDLTTGIRFHPIEIVLSMLIKLAVVSVLGPPVVGVLIFEVVLNALAMFNHANVRITLRLDRVLRWIIVTPDMHRVHHSVDDVEYTTNFGFNLSWWDRLLGTYLDQPAKGHQGMIIGLENFRHSAWQTIPRLLAMPFFRRAAIGAGCATGKMRREQQ